MKQITIYGIVDGKKIIFGTAEINEIYGDPVYHPMKITEVDIHKVNITRGEGDIVKLDK